MELKYRPNVAAIIRDKAGRILICERLDMVGAWQFPQGGVDPGETYASALKRELQEEVSLKSEDYRILQQKGPYRYLLGEGRTKKGYHGQEQQYFLIQLLGPTDSVNIKTEHPEFSNCKWIAPDEFRLEWLPAMKQPVYRLVMMDFFGIQYG